MVSFITAKDFTSVVKTITSEFYHIPIGVMEIRFISISAPDEPGDRSPGWKHAAR